MGPSLRQAAIVTLLFPLLANAAPRGPYAQQLARECDALIEDAVRRPYGWGWDTVPLETPGGRNTPRHVLLEPPGTPGAALILLWASQLLDEPKYQQAAIEAARGIAASQAPTGKIPEHVIFGPSSASPRDPTVAIPDRSATRAALALLIILGNSGAQPDRPEPLARSAQRAAQWLIRQQAEDGAWAWAHVSDAQPQRVNRIIRLDTPEYRDSTLALLMAGDALGDPDVVKAANRAVSRLIDLRLGAAAAAPTTSPLTIEAPEPDRSPQRVAANITNLWTTAYRMDGAIDPKLTEFPLGADLVATRLAMQTLIGAYLVNGQQPIGLALESASRTASQLRENDGRWRRLVLAVPTTQPDEPQPFFGPPTSQPHRIAGSFNMPQTLEATRQLRQIGQVRYLNMLGGPLGLHQQLATTICGMNDSPFTLDIPLTRDEVEPFLKANPERFEELNWGIPRDLSNRVQRLWVLLLRTRLEMMQQNLQQ